MLPEYLTCKLVLSYTHTIHNVILHHTSLHVKTESLSANYYDNTNKMCMILHGLVYYAWGSNKFAYVCVDNSKTVLKTPQILHPINISKPAGREKIKGSHQGSNSGSPVLAADALTMH